jgi:outer membrane protein OmpA-like peptidoglycan-associated protein
MSNLFSTIQKNLSPETISNISELIGSNASATQTGITRLFPNILKKIVNVGSTETGASSIINLIKNNALGASTINNLSSILSGGEKSNNFLEKGSKISSALFGNNTSDIAQTSGLSGQSSTKLLNIATPLIMSSVGKVIEKDNLDAKGLQKYLQTQDNFVPADVTSSAAVTGAANSSGGSIFRWLLPLLILGAIAIWFFTRNNGTVESASDNAIAKTETTTTTKAKPTHTHADGTVHEGHSHGSSTTTTTTKAVTNKAASTDETSNTTNAYTVDASGNLVDADGKIIFKKGEFTMKDGEYYDMEGKRVGFFSKVGGAIGDGAKAVGGAVGGAATATADAFKNVFGGMFKKKKEGAPVANYTLSNITFNRDNHKIENFSKNEVVGLANALKAYPDSKVKVQVYTNDGDDDGNNKKLSKSRAEVVRDMLVTLGVDKKQISYDGMGAGDVSKAIRDKVEIVVE